MSNKTVTYIFYAAALFNIGGILTFSLFFTNPLIAKYDPIVFSSFGQFAIILWGLAYLAVSKTFKHVKALMLVFAFEKLVYVIAWIVFLLQKGSMLPDIFNESFITGMFFGGYGIGDFIFGCFFAWVGIKGDKIGS